jgi:hypothetical protein
LKGCGQTWAGAAVFDKGVALLLVAQDLPLADGVSRLLEADVTGRNGIRVWALTLRAGGLGPGLRDLAGNNCTIK